MSLLIPGTGHPDFKDCKSLALGPLISRRKKQALNTATKENPIILNIFARRIKLQFLLKPTCGLGDLQLECKLVEFAFKVLLMKSPSWSPAGRR